MKKSLAFCAFLFSIQLLYAQVNTDTVLADATLQQCIQYALDHQPAVKQAQLQEEIVAYNIRSRLADWYPQIGATYSLQHNFQRTTSVFNGTPAPVGVKNTSTGQLYLDQTIFNRDVLLANRTQGDVRLQVRQQTAAEKINITVNVSKAYYDILTTQQQIKVADENIARLQKSLEDAYYRYQSGVTDKTDYKRAQIALNNTRATRQVNAAALVANVENLKNYMGYPVNAPLSIVYDSLQMEREVDFDTLQFPDYSQRIEYQQLLTQKRLQEANVLYQRNAFLPNVSATAVYNLNYLNNNFGKLYTANYPNSFIGLTAGIPIFQGGKRKANVRSAQLSVEQIDLELINLQNAISNQYAAALSRYKASLANYLASKENVSLAQEVYDVINLQYKAGVKTYLEVINAETDLRTSQINYFNALNQVLASKVDAQRALGRIRY
ncbi:MAG TPA: TolC family protein [Flavisolibacter sp.]|nr:TolC family protein [Flavisolibacter sp.]